MLQNLEIVQEFEHYLFKIDNRIPRAESETFEQKVAVFERQFSVDVDKYAGAKASFIYFVLFQAVFPFVIIQVPRRRHRFRDGEDIFFLVDPIRRQRPFASVFV